MGRMEVSEYDQELPQSHTADSRDTYVGSGHFGGLNILNFNIFGGFQKKMNIFGVMKILWIFLGESSQIGLYFGVISMHFRV